jgi:glutathionylspermidine synthase
VSETLEAGPSLSLEAWNRLRTRAIFECCKWDPQSEDRPVLARYPIFLHARALEELKRFSECLATEALEAEKELLSRPDLWSRLGIPRKIRRVMRASSNRSDAAHVRVMRFDFHPTNDGWRISEVNADVPGGYVEGSGWNWLFAEEIGTVRITASPSRRLAEALRDSLRDEGAVALVHATNYSDDRQVMMHLGTELRREGIRALLAGPENVEWKDGRAFLRSKSGLAELSAVMRFFPAEWLPQLRSRGNRENWFRDSQTVLCNPGSAILLQSKRFPLVWEDLKTKLNTWRRLLPTTIDPKEMSKEEEWVIKPAFGRVGEDVGMKDVSSDKEFRKLLRSAKWHSRDWIAQQRFQTLALQTEEGSVYPCCGVFTVNGRFAGIYGRAGRTPLINHAAQDVAVLLRDDSKESTKRGAQ